MNNDQDYIEANRQRLAQLEAALNEADAALDLDARARAAGFDLASAKAMVDRVAASASPQAKEQAQALMAEMDAAEREARAKALADMSRTTGSAASTRRPRNMA
jgi:hypothetical protein